MGESFAVVNDEAYEHSLLTVYVDPDHERASLGAAGFTDVTAIDLRGRRNPAAFDDPWIYYVARKPAADAFVTA